MNMYNKILAIGFCMAPVLLAGCADDNEGFKDPGTIDVTTNPGVISQKNFSILASDVQPTVIDPATGIFTKTDVTLTVYVGDRNNQTLTGGHEVGFVSEYGLINPPTCTTDETGTCEVTWSATKRPDPGGPGDDMLVTITAYAAGEDSLDAWGWFGHPELLFVINGGTGVCLRSGHACSGSFRLCISMGCWRHLKVHRRETEKYL